MAPSDRQNDDTSAAPAADPFTSFSRFVDEQMSEMLQSILGLPSSKEPPTAWRPRAELERREDIPSYMMQGSSGNSQSYYTGQPSVMGPDPSNEGSKLKEWLQYQYNKNLCGCPPLWNSERQQAFYDSDHYSRNRPEEATSQLQDFLNTSPYSPINLAKEGAVGLSPNDLRRAFCELMEETQIEPNHSHKLDFQWHNPTLNPTLWTTLMISQFSQNYHLRARDRQQRMISGVAMPFAGGMHPNPYAARTALNRNVVEEEDDEADNHDDQEDVMHDTELDMNEAMNEYERDAQRIFRELELSVEQARRASRLEHLFPDEQDSHRTSDYLNHILGSLAAISPREAHTLLSRILESQEMHQRDHLQLADARELVDLLGQLVDEKERTLAGTNNEIHEQPHWQGLSSQVSPENDSTKPSIIGMMTTIRTETLPDGTIESKRVLKKRFADGTEKLEESSEIIGNDNVSQPGMSLKASTPTQETKKKGGWFWN